MRENFDAIMVMIFLHEGGYVDHPQDPGSATKLGITRETLASWLGHPVSKADVKALTRKDATSIYRANYWRPIWGDKLPSGVDCAVMDFGVNAGASRAVRFLQALVGAEADGLMGAATLKAVERDIATHTVEILLHAYWDEREAYYRSLKTFPIFGKGWVRRNLATLKLSLDLAIGA